MIVPQHRNPRINSRLNPRINSAINPLINSSLNPILNSNINPILNSAINPILNSAINPILNSAINPILNSAINPIINTSINPLVNSRVNPNLNVNFPGEYIFDWNTLVPVGVAIRATELVKVLFDVNLRVCGYVVRANHDVGVWFDKHAKRLGEWVANGSGGSNIYNIKSQVVGLTS